MSPRPTGEELDDLSLACQRLWDLDVNRMNPEVDYAIDIQEGKKPWRKEDVATKKLFEYVKKDHFFAQPTYKSFFYLLDNYSKETGVAEDVTRAEKTENWTFLNNIMDTPVMQYVHKYLEEKGHAESDEQSFKKQLYQTWFSLYRRETRNDSSGFEHVFIGESRDDKIIGFHNWIQFFIQENKGLVDYRGFVFSRSGNDDVNDQSRVLTVQFAWEGEEKNVSTVLMGTSPEYEIALYTLCFFCGKENNDVEIDDHQVNIKVYRINSKYGDKIGSAFPIAQ